MSNYKKIQIKKKNLPTNIDSEKFKKAWLKSFSLLESDILNLFEVLEPFFKSVKKILTDLKDPDYFLISLLSYIHSDPAISLKKLNLWLSNHNLKHEIKVIIFLRLSKIKKPVQRIRPLMAEYFFIQDLKYALSKAIKSYSNKKTSFYTENDYNYIEEPFETTGNRWYDYLLYLYALGYNNTEIANITNISRKTIINEGKKICLCLNLKQLKS